MICWHKKHLRCSALCYSKNDEVSAQTGTHNHPQISKSEIVFAHVKNDVKINAKNSTGSLKKIFENTINKAIEKNDLSIESGYPFAPTYRASQKHLYKLRKENLPPLPKERSDIIFEDDYARFTETNCHNRFLLFDTKDNNRIIAFSSDTQLEIISKSKRWNVDGTFKAAPPLYKQLY